VICFCSAEQIANLEQKVYAFSIGDGLGRDSPDRRKSWDERAHIMSQAALKLVGKEDTDKQRAL
jgi:hypothetical protein